MAGYIIPVVPKRLIDFGVLPNGSTQDLILADRIELLHWREVNLTVQVHQHAVAGGGSITIIAIAQSWTSAEPETTFLGSEFQAGAITSSTVSPTLITFSLAMGGTNCMTALARVIARGVGAGAASLRAVVTVEFAVKDA